MSSETVYRLWDGVQVRKEKFGLLFYDYRGPRLYFLPTKDLIEETFFLGQDTASELVDSICSKYGSLPKPVRKQVNRILEMLRSKGLIYEQPVC